MAEHGGAGQRVFKAGRGEGGGGQGRGYSAQFALLLAVLFFMLCWPNVFR